MVIKSSVTYDDKAFKKLALAVGDTNLVEVGIMGEKAAEQHADSEYTNVQIGAVHEMGSLEHNIPRRSFLFDPLSEKCKDWFQDPRVKEMYFNYAADGQITKFYQALRRFAEQTVDRAFKTSNWGKWPDLKPETVKRRKGGGAGTVLALMDTGQLRRSITSRIVKR